MAAGVQNTFGAIGRLFARTSVRRGVVICTVFATVLSAGAYATSDHLGLLHWLRARQWQWIRQCRVSRARPPAPRA